MEGSQEKKCLRGRARVAAQRERVREALEQSILTGAYPPGGPLPGQRELARHYGVNRTILQHALGTLVSRGILSCEPKIGYRVSAVVRDNQAMAVRKIGVVWGHLPTVMRQGEMAWMLERVIAEAGHAVLYGENGYHTARENETLQSLRSAGIDSLIIAPARGGERSTELERWIGEGRPVVLHGHPGRWRLPEALAERCDQVDVDNRQGIHLLMDDLAALGHRRFGYVAGEPLEGTERYGAFLAEIAGRGLGTDRAWQLELNAKEPAPVRDMLVQIRRDGSLPTALVCSHDWVAHDVLRTLRELGIRCPGEVSVTGFGLVRPGLAGRGAELTTIDEQGSRQIAAAMRLLSRQWAGEATAAEHIRVPPLLVRGASTGPARA